MHKSIAGLMFREIRKHGEMLTSWEDDWVVWDLESIRTMPIGQKFLWILRDNGSHIFMDNRNNAVGAVQSMPETAKLYLVTVQAIEDTYPNRRRGTVEPVNQDQAIRFLRNPKGANHADA